MNSDHVDFDWYRLLASVDKFKNVFDSKKSESQVFGFRFRDVFVGRLSNAPLPSDVEMDRIWVQADLVTNF
jgi:hypothetical protein